MKSGRGYEIMYILAYTIKKKQKLLMRLLCYASFMNSAREKEFYVKETPLLVVRSYFGAQVLGLLAVEQENFALKASAPSNMVVVVADAGNIHLLKS